MRKASRRGIPDRSPVRLALKALPLHDTCPERSEFAERVLSEATRRGFTEAARCVVLGDGSAWIWNTAKELFPQAIQILERFHAKEHLSKTGKAIYRDSEQGKKWIQRRYHELDQGRLKSLLKAPDRQAL
jgi:transposase